MIQAIFCADFIRSRGITDFKGVTDDRNHRCRAKKASRTRKAATGTVALGASAALAAAVAFTPGTAELGKPSMFADPALNASTSLLGGIALDPEGIVDSVPLFGPVVWDLIKDEFGSSNAIAVLPLSLAAAFAGKGQSATAFALLGIAAATTDVDIDVPLPLVPNIKLPTGQVACLGALTFAHSSTEGLCLNVLGVLDAGYNSDRGELSAALTNPLALLTDGIDAEELASTIINGGSLSQLLTSDFARLTLGGPELVKLSSSYAIQPIKLANGHELGGGLAIGWLGGTLVLFPTIASGPLARTSTTSVCRSCTSTSSRTSTTSPASFRR